MLAVANAKPRKHEAKSERFEDLREGKIQPGPVRAAFTRGAGWLSDSFGSPVAITAAILIVLLWAITGPAFAFSDLWLLIINTVTTVITFVMVFIIQNTQTRETKAINLKLDELLRAVPRARNEFMEAEEEDLEEILREKEIVARDDPTPPEHKVAQRANGKTGNGSNGKPR